MRDYSAIVARVVQTLPLTVQHWVGRNVVFKIRSEPSDLLGYYRRPDILLFTANLDRVSDAEVEITIVHEIGHALGLSDDDLRRFGYD